MKRILTAIVLIALVGALIFFGKLWMITLAAALVSVLAALEFRGFAEAGGCPIPLWWTISAVALFFLATFYRPLDTITAVAFVTLVLFAVSAFRMAIERVLWQTAVGLLMLVYIAYPLTLLPQILNEENGTALLLFLFICVWSGDIAALYVGKKCVGGCDCFGGGIMCVWYVVDSGGGLVDAAEFELHTAAYERALVGFPDPGCRAERGGAVWRPFGVGAETRCRGEGLRQHVAGAWGDSGPDRRAAGGRAGAVVRYRDPGLLFARQLVNFGAFRVAN
jgi:hypothetical protein